MSMHTRTLPERRRTGTEAPADALGNPHIQVKQASAAAFACCRVPPVMLRFGAAARTTWLLAGSHPGPG